MSPRRERRLRWRDADGRPIDLVERVAQRQVAGPRDAESAAWRRETFCLPRSAARDKAREWFERYPKAAYQTEIEFWRELADDRHRVRHAPPSDGGLRRLLCLRSGRHPSALCRSDFESG